MSAEHGVSVIGLGKLGSPIAASIASKGIPVIGVDADPEKVRAIREGRPPVFEPGLAERIAAAGDRLSATDDVEAAVLATQSTFIVVSTPSEENGNFSLRYVLPVCEAIGRALRRKERPHLVVLTSTVSPGTTGGPVRARLEEASGKRCGEGFTLCYGPEFIALGSVIRDFLNPDFLLIGESDPAAGALLAGLYDRVCENHPPLARMSFVNAEITNLAVNTYVTTKISFANMLARLCERLPGADVEVVTSALGLDSRIGRKSLKGAVGYGGPCFPRDNLALAALARQAGSPALLAEATDRANREEVQRLAALVREKLPAGGAVGVLGLAYKPQSDVVEESQGLLLARALAAAGIRVLAYDPQAMGSAQRACGADVAFAASAAECVRAADVVVVTTPWDAFRSLEPAVFARTPRRTLIDCWRIFDAGALRAVVDYVPLGVYRS